jgi:hypothetical protein
MQDRTLPKELEQFILNLSAEKLEIATEIIKALSKTQIHGNEPTFIIFKDPKHEQKNMFLILTSQEHIFTTIQEQMKEKIKQIEKNEEIPQPRKRNHLLDQKEEVIGSHRREECFKDTSEHSNLPRNSPEMEKTTFETFLEEMEENSFSHPSFDEYLFERMENPMKKAPIPIEKNHQEKHLQNPSKGPSPEKDHSITKTPIEPKRTKPTPSFDRNVFVEYSKSSPPESCENLSHYCM